MFCLCLRCARWIQPSSMQEVVSLQLLHADREKDCRSGWRERSRPTVVPHDLPRARLRGSNRGCLCEADLFLDSVRHEDEAGTSLSLRVSSLQGSLLVARRARQEFPVGGFLDIRVLTQSTQVDPQPAGTKYQYDVQAIFWIAALLNWSACKASAESRSVLVFSIRSQVLNADKRRYLCSHHHVSTSRSTF